MAARLLVYHLYKTNAKYVEGRPIKGPDFPSSTLKLLHAFLMQDQSGNVTVPGGIDHRQRSIELLSSVRVSIAQELIWIGLPHSRLAKAMQAIRRYTRTIPQIYPYMYSEISIPIRLRKTLNALRRASYREICKVTGGIGLEERIFELAGHDCPLGDYPSIAVPVGKIDGQLVAVYSGEDGATFRPVDQSAKYNRHNRATASTLRDFDPLRHGLFAFNETDIVIYDLGKEKSFCFYLLRSSAAFFIEPFYRLSLAVETAEMSLIRPVYFSCAKHLTRDAPELSESWMKTIQMISPSVEMIQKEWLRRLALPHLNQPSPLATVHRPRPNY